MAVAQNIAEEGLAASSFRRVQVSPNRPGWEQLVGVVQQLSMARDLARIMEIVRHAARELTGADGATFVLADNECCWYADEDAIAPLWKGKRFPMSMCISGWVMQNRCSVVIPDIYKDPRIPSEAYRPTFVKSLAMVPIRTEAPLGAIGNYWATARTPTAEQVAILQALADTTSVAMENVALYGELEQRVRNRTRELEAANRELEAFSYSVSHDLRAPLRAITGFTEMLRSDYGDKLDAAGLGLLGRVSNAGTRMGELIEALLGLARLTRSAVRRERVDLTEIAKGVVSNLRVAHPERVVNVSVEEGLTAEADTSLVRIVLDNLLSNAWKYSARESQASITFGAKRVDGETVFHVRDNGVGFDMTQAERLFAPFQRLHAASEFPGTGIGLATVQRIVHRHSGRIWVEAAPGEGATFFFTLAEAEKPSPMTVVE